MLKLIIEDDEGRKTVVPFARDEITIGRQEGNTIRLTERNVSRRHARLLRQNGHVLIEDLGSYNGIRVNGDRIAGQVQVADGDLIQIGDYDLAIQAEELAAATVPLERGQLAPTAKVQETSPTMPALPIVDLPQASDEDVQDASDEEDHVDAAPKHQSTAVIRIDQIEGANRSRQIADIDAADAPRLVVLNTDLAGKEFPCTRTELKIGRTDDNDVAIDHRSLSRTHCKIVREDSGEWRVIDMQSANGLMVNGESYAQVTLRPGDVIELGHVKLKFVGPGENVSVASSASNITQETGPTGSKAPMIAIVIAVLVIVIGGGGYMMWKSRQPAGGGTVRVDKPPKQPKIDHPKIDEPPKVDPEAVRQANAKKIEDAKAAIGELDFIKAEALLNDCQLNGTMTPEAKALISQMDSERGVKTALETAAKLLDSGELDKAQTQLQAAASATLLRARYDELEARRAKLVKEKIAANTKVEPPKNPPPVNPPPAKVNAEVESLLQEGNEFKKKKNLEGAVIRFERCIKLDPKFHACYRQLASTYASIASRDQSQPDMEKAKKYYERFLEVAPPDDDYVPKVKQILEQAKQQK